MKDAITMRSVSELFLTHFRLLKEVLHLNYSRLFYTSFNVGCLHINETSLFNACQINY